MKILNPFTPFAIILMKKEDIRTWCVYPKTKQKTKKKEMLGGAKMSMIIFLEGGRKFSQDNLYLALMFKPTS